MAELATELSGHLKRLDEVLVQQGEGLARVAAALPQKAALIQKHRLKELEAFVKLEASEVEALRKLESERGVLSGFVARALGVPTQPPPRLDALAQALGGAWGDRLRAHHAALGPLVEDLKAKQAQVAELLKLNLDFVHHELDLMAQLAATGRPLAYGAEGQAEKRSSFILDSQA